MAAIATGVLATATGGRPTWKDGMCDCFSDFGMCCQSLFCMPCTMANVFNKRAFGVASPGCDCCTCFTASLALYLTNGHYLQWMAMGLRREMIQNYSINDESECESCARGYFCPLCVFCQVQRELADRGAHAGGCCANDPNASIAGKIEGAGKAALNELVQTAGTGGIPPHAWSSGLCDCEASQCCEGCCCPCCTLGYMATKADSQRMTNLMAMAGAVDQRMDPAACCGSLWTHVAWVYMVRREMIERYNILGESQCNTFCCVTFCPCCSLMQARREMGFCDEWAGGLMTQQNPCPVKYGVTAVAKPGGIAGAIGKILS